MSGVLHGIVASLKAAAAAATDSFWKYVTLLLNTSTTNGAQNNTFLDSSTNNFSITRNGDTTQGSFNPYMPSGYWSGYFDGTGDYLAVADNAAFDLAASDFTVETWVNFSALPAASGAATLVSQWPQLPATNRGWWFYAFNNAGTYQLYLTYSTNGTAQSNLGVSLPSAPAIGTWNHVAFVRSGNNFLVFWNGTQVGTTQTLSATIFNSGGEVWIGAQNEAAVSYTLTGYQSNLRIVKGTAVYTANFTPSTTPLTAITNTSLLCLQDNRFKDNSANAFAITVNGDTRISKFAPFNPPASYSTTSYGGSGYFDGTGDYLNTSASPATLSGDFTIEGWVYIQSLATARALINLGDSFAATGVTFYVTTTGRLGLFGNNAVLVNGTTQTVAINTWTHIAFVRASNTVTLYVNGVADATTLSNSTSFTGVCRIGAEIYNTSFLQALMLGYISNARIVAGTAVYTAAFTPPTTPLTAITNTSLLLNFTNAGIYDAATINNGQTVADAQVSTTQAKWGTTSMYFDGTGDYLVTPSKQELEFGTGNFTIEFWWYPSTLATTQPIIYHTNNLNINGAGQYVIVYNTTLGMRFYLNAGGAGSVAQGATTGWSTGTWYHVAVVRSGTTLTIYRDGVSIASGSNSATVGSAVPTYIGGEPFDPLYATGYLQDLRITNGYARYTANFTAPTAAFPTL